MAKFPAKAAMTSELYLSVLGRPRIELDGRPPAALVPAKALALLTYLVLTRTAYTRTALAGLLWGDLPEEAARANLRQTLTKLRKVVGDHVLIQWETVAFNPALPHRVDALEFMQLVDSAEAHHHRRPDTCALCAQHLQQAIALYQHPLLHDFTLADCAELELWAMIEREQLQQRALAACERLAAYAMRQTDYTSAQRYARRLLDLDPFNESAHRQLMRALARNGQRTAALAQYQSCQRLFAAEFGAAPELATQALHEEIKRDQLPAAFAPARRNLPTETTMCIGREHHLAAILQHIETPHKRLLTLVGPGGVGKTRLAIAAADLLAWRFDDGVAFVALAPLRDAMLVASAIAQVVGVEVRGLRPIDEQLKQALHAREVLLVLDNLEHLLQAVPLLSELLAGCPRLTILATSREPLRLRGEQVYPVPPLAVPRDEMTLSLEGLLQFDAVQLFVQRMQAYAPDFVPSLDSAHAITTICRRVDGLPLAIELATGHIEWHASGDLLERLRRAAASLPLLSGGARDLPLRQQTMRATIAWSVDLLDPAAQRVLRQVAVFVGGFTAAAAALVCGEHAGDAPRVAQASVTTHVVTLLAEKQLLTCTTENSELRYAMLETIREYALEQLDESGETYACSQRHAACFVTLAEQAAPELTGPDQQQWLDQLQRENNNMRAALDWALSADEIDLALQLMCALWRFWDARSYQSEGRRWLSLALDRTNQATRLRAQAFNSLGNLAYSQSDVDVARTAFNAALVLYRFVDYTRGTSISLHNLGLVAWAQGNYAAAQDLYQESLVLDQRMGDRAGTAYTLNSLGLIFFNQGNLAQAQAAFTESLAIFREFGNRRHEAFGLCDLGIIAYHLHDLETAHTCYQASVTISAALGDKRGLAMTFISLAQLLCVQGDSAAACALLHRCLALWRELDSNLGLVKTLDQCAIYAIRQRQLEAATVLLGATHALRQYHGLFHHAVERTEHERHVAIVRRAQTAGAFATAWACGRALTFDQAVVRAVSVLEATS